MRRDFIPELTYMRGLCMLGVVGIHVGSYALANPHANHQLIGLLEILSRFCVPAFFFLSAFGLFYHTSAHTPLSYKDFIRRRMRVVLQPYLVWSLLYTLYTAITTHDLHVFLPRYLLPSLFFGNASYQLYFMVILLWFYLLMPLWRAAVRFILPHASFWLAVIFFIQTAFNYWISAYGGKISFDNPALQYAYSMRLNYWVIHYIWIFLLGAVMAERYEDLKILMWKHRLLLTVFFVLSTALMLGSYYYVLDEKHYTLLEAIYTIHQLSPQGMLYTGAGTVFFLFFFAFSPLSSGMRDFWQAIGDTSYGIYLVHPFALFLLNGLLHTGHFLYRATVVIGLYISTICLSYLATRAIQQLPEKVRRLLLGS